MLAKVVTKSRPLLVQGGNSWISDVVYKIDEKYYKREVQAPTLKHGPFEIGEEIELEPSAEDLIADDYLVQIYENPANYNEIMLNFKYDIESNKYIEFEKKAKNKKKSAFLDVIIALLIVFIVGVILYTLILG